MTKHCSQPATHTAVKHLNQTAVKTITDRAAQTRNYNAAKYITHIEANVYLQCG